jgi:hypothetical protein
MTKVTFFQYAERMADFAGGGHSRVGRYSFEWDYRWGQKDKPPLGQTRGRREMFDRFRERQHAQQ